MGAYLAALMIGHKNCSGEFRAETPDMLFHQALKGGLKRSVERQPVMAFFGTVRFFLARQMSREHWETPAAFGHAIGLGSGRIGLGKGPSLHGSHQHPVPRPARTFRKPVWPPQFRRLGQRHQKRGFMGREPPRLLAEIGERSGAYPF
ncbi:hypothetical protein MnTg02_02249 [bacterium MnTg02]|nr:hypothetical protein MnTg02_02249 [bacterium MnTg02]